MIVRQNKGYETRTDKPNVDWYNEGNYVVDETTEEGKLLAGKIKAHAPYFDFVLDGNKLIDIIPLEKPVTDPTKEEINRSVVSKIREVYSIDNEFQMQRLGLQDNSNQEYQDYLAYVNECIEWGNTEKAKYGYL